MRSPWLVCAIFTLIAAVAIQTPPAAGEVRSFGISQALQLDEGVPAVRVYLDAGDEKGAPSAEIGPSQLTATLGEFSLDIRESYPFRAGGEGVAYVFLIDISRSLSSAEFGLILEALDVWILSLRPVDRVAVIAFGDESRVVVDFTADKWTVKSALYSLGPTDNQTVLHEALRDGLELCRRRDPDLPGRRVMMVLTDGRDEGSGLTTDDVLTLLRHDPVPVYAIGLSRLRDPGLRKRYLDLLRRIAANSGGAFYEGSTEALGTAYEAIRRDIHGVWVADFACPACRADGEEYRLQVELQDGGRVLSAGRSLRLLPLRKSPAALVREGSAPGPSKTTPPDETGSETETVSVASPEEPAKEQETSRGLPGWLWLVPLLALGAGVWLFVRRSRAVETPTAAPVLPPRGDRRLPSSTPAVDVEILGVEAVETETETAETESGPIPRPQTYQMDTGVETSRPPRPAIMRVVRLIVVRGSKPGRQYTLTLFKNAVVGSRSTCDCVLVEPGVAPEQFEIFQLDGRVYIKSLSGTSPTLVDGLPTTETEQTPLKSGALVGTRDFILRVAYEDARPINT